MVMFTLTGLASAQSDTSTVHALRLDLIQGGFSYERKLSRRFSASATIKAGLVYWGNNFGPTPKRGIGVHPQVRLDLRYYIVPLKKRDLSGLYAIGLLNYGTHRVYSADDYLHKRGFYPITPLIHLGVGYQYVFWKYFYFNSSVSYGLSSYGRGFAPRPLYSINLNLGLNLPLK